MDVHGREISPQGEASPINQKLEATRENSSFFEMREAAKDFTNRSNLISDLAKEASGALPSSIRDDIAFDLVMYTAAALSDVLLERKS